MSNMEIVLTELGWVHLHDSFWVNSKYNNKPYTKWDAIDTELDRDYSSVIKVISNLKSKNIEKIAA
jgi:hypothetical protein